MDQGAWKLCSSCKKNIGFATTYYACSVSTCRSKRNGMYFCSPPCFEAHLPMMRHRDAWAEEELSPTKAEAESAANAEANKQRSAEASGTTRRRIAGPSSAESGTQQDDLPKEVLVVASKLKKYVRAKASMNTSDSAMDVISDHLRWLSVRALRRAAQEGRKTVLDRDFSAVIRELHDRG